MMDGPQLMQSGAQTLKKDVRGFFGAGAIRRMAKGTPPKIGWMPFLEVVLRCFFTRRA